ncbi:MAG: hypothetical protein ACOH5I_22835 [Oligoflexus sp.]
MISFTPCQFVLQTVKRLKYFKTDPQTGERKIITAPGPLKLKEGSRYTPELAIEVTDGHASFRSLASDDSGLILANDWRHARRKFKEAQKNSEEIRVLLDQSPALPESSLGRAIAYADKLWEGLTVFFV